MKRVVLLALGAGFLDVLAKSRQKVGKLGRDRAYEDARVVRGFVIPKRQTHSQLLARDGFLPSREFARAVASLRHPLDHHFANEPFERDQMRLKILMSLHERALLHRRDREIAASSDASPAERRAALLRSMGVGHRFPSDEEGAR